MATETKTFYPQAYDTSISSSNQITNPTNPVGKGSDNSNYAGISLSYSSGTCNIYWPFDVSAIPEDAIIDSVVCKAKASVSSVSQVYKATLQLCSGTTGKGEATDFKKSSAAVYTLSVGAWTREELNAVRLLIHGERSSGSSTLRFYGADLTVVYSVKSEKFMLKLSGSYHDIARVFQKIDGIWIEQDDLNNVVVSENGLVNGGEIESTVPATKTVTITGEGKLDPGTSSTIYCYIVINGVQYYTATTLTVNPGTQIVIHVSGSNNSITIDGEAVLNRVMGVYTHTFTVDNDCTIDLVTTTYGGNVTITTQ